MRRRIHFIIYSISFYDKTLQLLPSVIKSPSHTYNNNNNNKNNKPTTTTKTTKTTNQQQQQQQQQHKTLDCFQVLVKLFHTCIQVAIVSRFPYKYFLGETISSTCNVHFYFYTHFEQ